ncbi:MAG: hypothetical protein K9L68_11100, partial [Spirochaetales bacterium]|nr:hypothetical protein [Spirochaetales bacterium]MCF7939133.1 hypothetical protein [Spirochaetales bacterium]
MNPYRGEESRSEGTFHYHYNRDERLAQTSDKVRNRYRDHEITETDGKKKKRGNLFTLFRRNRALLIVFLDVVAIAIIFIFFTLIGVLQPESSGTIGSIDYRLRAFVYDEQVLVSLSIETEGGEPDAQEVDPQQIISIRFETDTGRKSREFREITPFGGN